MFPSGWSKLAILQTDSSKVSGGSDLINFPTLIKDGNLPNIVYDNIQSAGQDLRFTIDSAGAVQVPFEIVAINTGARTSEIWVKLPTLFSSSATVLYVWGGNPSASAYAASDPFGSQNVWRSEFSAVMHMGDLTTSTISDSTANGRTGTKTSANNPVEADAKIGKGQTFSSDLINLGDYAGFDMGTGEFAIIVWARFGDIAGNNQAFFGKLENAGSFDGYYARVNTSGFIEFIYRSGATPYTATDNLDITDTTFRRVAFVRRSTGIYVYVNGVEEASNTNAAVQNNEDNADALVIASERSGSVASAWPGTLDEFFVWKGTAPTAGWLVTEYNNQNDPSTFWISGIAVNYITSKPPWRP